MKVLLIGGTRFVGKTITESALNRGHDITHFNRGICNPDLFKGKVDIIHIIEKEGLKHCFPMYYKHQGAKVGYCRISNKKAVLSGLKLRNYRETFKDIYGDHISKGIDYQLKEGMPEEAYNLLINY